MARVEWLMPKHESRLAGQAGSDEEPDPGDLHGKLPLHEFGDHDGEAGVVQRGRHGIGEQRDPAGHETESGPQAFGSISKREAGALYFAGEGNELEATKRTATMEKM